MKIFNCSLKSSNQEAYLLDPFLLLDNFHSDNPNDYIAGFPDHSHRGIETVTYMIEGKIEHRDSICNKCIIQSGDIQRMTAGSSEIPIDLTPDSSSPLLCS